MIHARPRYWQLSPAAMLGLKLYALAAMVADHADWMLFDGALGFHATWGRTVFPVFAVLLANNVARWGTPQRMTGDLPARMAAFGLLASVPYVYLQGSLLPLNVMFTLAAGVLVCGLIQSRAHLLAAAVFAVAGVFVDYSWVGLLAVMLPWAAFRGYASPLWWFVAACGLLTFINGNLWALAAVPLVAVATYVQGDAPRWKWLFYVAYPLHLAALAAFAWSVQ
jgi:hypothetical protein